MFTWLTQPRNRYAWVEWIIILVVVTFYGRETLLNLDPQRLQQTGEHNESATLPLLAEIGLNRNGEIPLWNPYMLTGFPHAGDPINHFWNPVATVPVMIWGGINGMKVSIYLSLLVAAYGQWLLAHTLGVRGFFRLWAALLFGLSGGLALLWRLGWYELLVGAAWFPWAFAFWWRALHRPGWLSVVLAALSIALILTTGGGYYPLYLAVSLSVLGLVVLAQRWTHRREIIRHGLVVAALALLLSAVYWIPIIDGYRLTARDAMPDLEQAGSQRLAYALFNYVVQDEDYYRAAVLNQISGNNWFYIGALSLLGLVFTPWLYAREPRRRRVIVALVVLIVVLLLWHANRYTPVGWLYDRVPFLYTFRFPNRLLIILTSPLLALSALSLQGVYDWAQTRWGELRLNVSIDGQNSPGGLRFGPVLWGLTLVVLALSALSVYRVNKAFGMIPSGRNLVAGATLDWLRERDPELYYTNIGGGSIYWDWMPFAYEREMPVINFRYNRRVRSMDEQMGPDSPFRAEPRYVIASADQPAPPNAEVIHTVGDLNVWYRPDVLPFAFSVPAGGVPSPETAVTQTVRLDGPNRVIVEGTADEGDQLVVLVSDYPGWRLEIDGQRADVEPLNGYLGATMETGIHTYRFSFQPVLHTLGLLLTLAGLAGCVGLVAWDFRHDRATAMAVTPQPMVQDGSWMDADGDAYRAENI